MAEAPAALADTQQAQPAPTLTSLDGLDAAMAAARQVASEQQSALETENAQPGAQERTAVTPAPTTEEQAAPVQPAEQSAPEDEGEEQETPADQPPGKPSRMGRLREQLTQAEQAKREAEARFQERLAVDHKVRQKYAALLGTPDEKAQLEGVIANPLTSAAELNVARSRLGQMRQAGEELAPLYTAVEQDVFAGFVRGLETLRTLDGMDEQGHQSLLKAASGVDALKLMHGIGRKAAEEEFKGEIASLKAEVSALKTKQAATGVQPAGAGGRAPGATGALAGLVDERGLPTEEAIARARAGGLRHLGAAAAA